MSEPFTIDWYNCIADTKEEAEAGNCKIGDTMWRVPKSIGPLTIDHNHWAGWYFDGLEEEDYELILAVLSSTKQGKKNIRRACSGHLTTVTELKE